MKKSGGEGWWLEKNDLGLVRKKPPLTANDEDEKTILYIFKLCLFDCRSLWFVTLCWVEYIWFVWGCGDQGSGACTLSYPIGKWEDPLTLNFTLLTYFNPTVCMTSTFGTKSEKTCGSHGAEGWSSCMQFLFLFWS